MSDDEITRISVNPPKKAKPKGLGRGLGALMGETRREEPLVGASRNPVPGAEPEEGALTLLAVAEIVPDPKQPRRHFDEAALEELASSIGQRGVIQPVIVRPAGSKGKFRLVAGERRWRAAQKARVHEIPAIVRDLTDRDVMAIALIENLQREDLNPIEEARAYQRLSEEEEMTQSEIAKLVDKSRSHVANLQRLLALPEDVIVLVETGKLTMGHARALIGHEDASNLARLVVAQGMSVREVEKAVRQSQEPEKPRAERKPATSQDNADIAAVQTHLEEFLGMPVRIQAEADPTKGALTVRYASLDQLDLLCQRLTGETI